MGNFDAWSAAVSSENQFASVAVRSDRWETRPAEKLPGVAVSWTMLDVKYVIT